MQPQFAAEARAGVIYRSWSTVVRFAPNIKYIDFDEGVLCIAWDVNRWIMMVVRSIISWRCQLFFAVKRSDQSRNTAYLSQIPVNQ